MSEYQQDKDVLLMTSAFEGLPMVLTESMSNGVVPVVTAVDGIPEHIEDGVTGFLIDQPDDEDHVVRKAVAILEELCNSDPERLKRISDNCFRYARLHFGQQQFVAQYRATFGFN